MAFGGRGSRHLDVAGSSQPHPYPDVPDQRVESEFVLNESANATAVWLNKLKHVWTLWKKSEGVTRMLNEYFASAPNPYTATLYIMSHCEDFHQSKSKSLSFTVMEEFSKWILTKQTEFKWCLTEDVKSEAFYLSTQQRNSTLTKMMFCVYQLLQDKELFIEPIRELTSRRLYKEACQSAALLCLHQYFTVQDFVIPLVFQDKLSVAEEFLADSLEHQKCLVSFLDSLLSKRNIRSEAESIIRRLNIPDVKKDKLYHKPLSKLVARLTKMYNLPPETCPNLNQKRNEGALQFLMHKRFIDNTLGAESWREMVREAVGSSSELQRELVVSVNSYGDPHEALYWANIYEIPKHKQPYNVRMLQEDPDVCSEHCNLEEKLPTEPVAGNFVTEEGAAAAVEEQELWDDVPQVQYHVFPLPQSSIVVVDTEESFMHFLDYIKDVPMVGIDSEWKPYFGTRRNELALMQIASTEQVYIVDVINLGSECPNLWHELGIILFANQNIIKLGFDLVMDMNMMKRSLPHLAVSSFSGAGYLDLAVLWQKLVHDHSFVFPYTDDSGTSGESLSLLVQLCLGQPLDKSDQFSDWERRPLRDSQKLYAALDAYCLLEVQEVLLNAALEQNIPFYEICNEVMSDVKSPRKTTKCSKRQVKQQGATIELDSSPHTNPTPAGEFKVVCDNMIQGLGKMLRKCGIDTVILENGDNHDVCVRIAKQQHRKIVTRGHVYNKLCQHVPHGHCYPVASDMLEEQLEETLKYYNIMVTKQDVFSRCMVCNGCDFVIVPQAVMNRLVQSSQQRVLALQADEDSKWTEADAEGFSSESDAFSEEGTSPPCAILCENSMESGVFIDDCLTRKGVTIQVDAIPHGVLEQVGEFQICESCGKCYWDGSHFEKLVGGKLRNIVTS